MPKIKIDFSQPILDYAGEPVPFHVAAKGEDKKPLKDKDGRVLTVVHDMLLRDVCIESLNAPIALDDHGEPKEERGQGREGEKRYAPPSNKDVVARGTLANRIYGSSEQKPPRALGITEDQVDLIINLSKIVYAQSTLIRFRIQCALKPQYAADLIEEMAEENPPA